MNSHKQIVNDIKIDFFCEDLRQAFILLNKSSCSVSSEDLTGKYNPCYPSQVSGFIELLES